MKIKKILFIILVILLTPIYLIIKLANAILNFTFEITSPIASLMVDFTDNMINFGKEILKGDRK